MLHWFVLLLPQGKKFKDKSHSQWEQSGTSVPDSDIHFSDNDRVGKSDQYPLTWLKRPGDGAGDGFVRSVRGLFNSQKSRAKAFVLRTMRGETENDFHGDWSESEAEFSPFARQLTITKTKKLIRRHTKRFRSRGQKGLSSVLESYFFLKKAHVHWFYIMDTYYWCRWLAMFPESHCIQNTLNWLLDLLSYNLFTLLTQPDGSPSFHLFSLVYQAHLLSNVNHYQPLRYKPLPLKATQVDHHLMRISMNTRICSHWQRFVWANHQ